MHIMRDLMIREMVDDKDNSFFLFFFNKKNLFMKEKLNK